jgi:hypothetical protein
MEDVAEKAGGWPKGPITSWKFTLLIVE